MLEGNHGRIPNSEGWVFHAGGKSWKNNYLGGVGVPCWKEIMEE